ncbi:Methyl-CpG-binding domain-containing protein 9 [Platanthera guangdongensis]|uniref:Methyl-CpG-binding domain-containing protein 9 n=1 Tax=Platanthera guangdongensis TaxID=2320717 RepID=A0ABR2MN59_9ASPA
MEESGLTLAHIMEQLVRRHRVGVYEHDVFSRIGNHWRSTLVHMLNLPGVGEGGGIESCIHDALQSRPRSFTSKTKMADVAIMQPEDRYKGSCEIEDPAEVKVVFAKSTANGSNIKLENQTDINEKTAKFQNVLLEIFRSEDFASLCDLVCESFQNRTASKLLDFSLINSKLRNGVYEQMPVSFNEDIQQVFFNLHPFIFKSSVGEELGLEAGEGKLQANDNPQGTAELKNSMNSHVNGQFPLSDSDRSNKPDQSEASCLCKVHVRQQCGIETAGKHRLICEGCEAVYHSSCADPFSPELPSRSWYCASCCKEKTKSPELRVIHKRPIGDRPNVLEPEKNIPNSFKERDCSNKSHKVHTCKQCNTEAIGEHSLICDGCEGIYHISCVEPSFEEIPPRNWYCAPCVNGRTKEPEPVMESGEDGPHQNCSVCDRLDFSGAEKDARESSVSSKESGGPLAQSRTAVAHLCKLCGTCEDDDRRFLTCGNSYCPYKYYHIRCLKNSQIASQHQRNRDCWYCPSCLCRSCHKDQDDAEIVLCDVCDDAYHTYCMNPPRTSVPKGKWHCAQCNVARAKEGMRRHEQRILQQHCKKYSFQVIENNPLDILLNAVEKASCSTDQRP